MQNVQVRKANTGDLTFILNIYNQGIEDRIATLEMDTKDMAYIESWFQEHQGRYTVLVAETEGKIAGWASLNPYSHRCAYNGVADLSVYVERSFRGKGIGSFLLQELEKEAKTNQFYKIVLFTFPFNGLGQGLYSKMGYREVGVFKNQGRLDGQFVDVMAMEKLL
jgi:L-amino acid N-acyltransferase YncA